MHINDIKNCFIFGDAVRTMQLMPDSSVDLVVTSPPYNLKNSTGNGMKDGRGGKWANASLIQGYDTHEDNMPHDEYVAWQRTCLTEMLRLVKDDGAIFYNHKWRVQGGLLQDRSDIVAGFPVRQIIIWHRKGGINFNDGYFLPTYEVIYLIAKPNFKLASKACGLGDVWDIAQDRNNPHPAPFPVDLPKKIIGATNAQLILDPFMGSGSTALAARQLSRDFIGIDQSRQYCDMAQTRLNKDDNIE
jgi:site-specific DNA-methyltransferase (adenine-specific)